MIAYLRGERGSEVVEEVLRGSEPCFAHATNVCEVYYDFLRDFSGHAADEAIADLRNMGLTVREDMDEAFWKEVGRVKVKYSVSLADCFAVSLTDRCETTLLTSDRHEFEPLEQAGACNIKFIR